jgi:hypothetical protein
MTSVEKARIRRKWQRWLAMIGRDLGWLLVSHDLFLRIQEVFASNKTIQRPTLVYCWISGNYAAAVSVGVRRLADRDNRAVSLYRLIKDIEQNAEAITRDDFVLQYPKGMREEGCAQDDFLQFAGKGGLALSRAKLRRDVARLDRSVRAVRTFVDKHIAHRDADQKKFAVPTYDALGNALRDLDTMYCKYVSLIKQSGMTTCKWEIPYDWREPLRHPWIEMTDQAKEHRLRAGKPVWDKRTSL